MVLQQHNFVNILNILNAIIYLKQIFDTSYLNFKNERVFVIVNRLFFFKILECMIIYLMKIL